MPGLIRLEQICLSRLPSPTQLTCRCHTSGSLRFLFQFRSENYGLLVWLYDPGLLRLLLHAWAVSILALTFSRDVNHVQDTFLCHFSINLYFPGFQELSYRLVKRQTDSTHSFVGRIKRYRLVCDNLVPPD